MDYTAFTIGLNSVLTAYGLQVSNGVLADGTKEYKPCTSIQGVLNALWFYFKESGRPYTNHNEMLSDLLLLTDGSNAKYIKDLINYVHKVFMYHYKVKVEVAGAVTFSATGKELFKFEFGGVTYPIGVGDDLTYSGALAAGTYDLYVYSTVADEDLIFAETACTVLYDWAEHKIDYVVNITSTANIINFTSTKKSVRKVSFGGAKKTSANYNMQAFNASYENVGTYTISIFCDDIDETIKDMLSRGGSIGDRSVSY